MTPFIRLNALVVPIDRSNVDTDAIIPKQFMKSIKRTGFGDNLFDEWRYLDRGEPGQDVASRPKNPDFSLNQARYVGAKILLTRDNFGCGSSREHAPWALKDYGICALIASSFADIFYDNCFKNGILPIVLDACVIEELFARVYSEDGFSINIDLESQEISSLSGFKVNFDIDPARKYRLLNGLDDISLTLQKAQKIRLYEERRRVAEPWLFVR